jgi:hypothetical protein
MVESPLDRLNEPVINLVAIKNVEPHAYPFFTKMAPFQPNFSKIWARFK